MNNIQAFALWLLDEIPNFLMAEPICYFVGVILLFCIIRVISLIINLR